MGGLGAHFGGSPTSSPIGGRGLFSRLREPQAQDPTRGAQEGCAESPHFLFPGQTSSPFSPLGRTTFSGRCSSPRAASSGVSSIASSSWPASLPAFSWDAASSSATAGGSCPNHPPSRLWVSLGSSPPLRAVGRQPALARQGQPSAALPLSHRHTNAAHIFSLICSGEADPCPFAPTPQPGGGGPLPRPLRPGTAATLRGAQGQRWPPPLAAALNHLGTPPRPGSQVPVSAAGSGGGPLFCSPVPIKSVTFCGTNVWFLPPVGVGLLWGAQQLCRLSELDTGSLGQRRLRKKEAGGPVPLLLAGGFTGWGGQAAC